MTRVSRLDYSRWASFLAGLFLVFPAAAFTSHEVYLPDIHLTPIMQNRDFLPSAEASQRDPDPRAAGIAQRLREMMQSGNNMQTRSQSSIKSAAKPVAPPSASGGRDVSWTPRANGTVLQLRGSLPEQSGKSGGALDMDDKTALARHFLRAHRGVLGIHDPDQELALREGFEGDLQQTHLRFSQTYKGLPVWPADLNLHIDSENNSALVNGAFVRTPRKPLPIRPLVEAEEAWQAAVVFLAPRRLAQTSEPELIVYGPSQGAHRPAWKIDVEAAQDERWLVVVDALTGEVLTRFNQIMHNRVQGAGIDLSGRTQMLQTWQANNAFYLLDTSKSMFDPSTLAAFSAPNPNTVKGGIFILDLQNQTLENGAINYVVSAIPDDNWLADAVSAGFHLSEVYDYFLERHGRNSLDGQGGSMFGVVRTEQGMVNAFWNGQAMFFGDGLPFAGSLDVVGHELAHGVTQHTANLVYENQPGALNEAFSDIFGEMVEARTLGATDWRTGSALPNDFQRDMRSPGSQIISGLGVPYPSNMNEFFTITDDNGGVHINSSIINRAFYLYAEGLADAVGLRDAERVFYRALSTHLSANSQFIDARLAVITAAEELFGANSNHALKAAEAFDTVGIVQQASTPPPSSFPSVAGSDATLFACYEPLNGVYYLCRRDPAFGDSDLGAYLSQSPISYITPATTQGDGSIAAFVDSRNDMCLIDTDGNSVERCLGYAGQVNSVAMSPDGNRFAFVLRDSAGQPEDAITFIDLAANIEDTIPIVAPALDGSSSNTILYADAMDFSADGDLLVYDALNVLRLQDGSRVDSWSIYGLDLQTRRTFYIVAPQPGLNASFPSLGNTSDNFITFSATEPGSGQSTVYAGNLNTGEVNAVVIAAGEFVTASYTGDDLGLVYDTLDSSVNSGWSLLFQALAVDHRSPIGSPGVWLADALVPSIYRRGTYTGPVAATGYYDPATGFLRINAVDVPDATGVSVLQVEMKLFNGAPMQFYLTSFKNTQSNGANGSYNPATGIVNLPSIELTDDNGNTQVYSVQLQLLGGNPLQFQLTALQRLR